MSYQPSEKITDNNAPPAQAMNWTNFVPFIITFILLSISSYTAILINNNITHDNMDYFEELTVKTRVTLEKRFLLYEQALWGGSGLYDASEYVNREDWNTYVAALQMDQNLPGIHGLGFIRYVPNEAALMDFLDHTSSHEYQGFANHPETGFEDKFIIKYIVPEDWNMEAIGLDIGFEANRREAAERARDIGSISLTKKITLVQDEKRTPGFLLLMPVYSHGTDKDTLENRRKNLNGWVYAPIIGSSFLADLSKISKQQIGYHVYDGESLEQENLIYSTDYVHEEHEKLLSRSENITLGGNTWTIKWFASHNFDPALNYNLAIYFFIAGFIISITMFFLLRSMIKQHAVFKQKADETASRAQQQMAIQGTDLGLWDTNIETGFTYYDERWCSMLGYKQEELEPNFSSWEKLVHKDDLEYALKTFQDHLDGHTEQFEIETRMKCKDGSWKWILSRGKVFEKDANGKAARAIGTHLDISDRKDTEERLLTRTEMLELAEITAEMGHWHFNIQTKEVFWSEQIYKIHGVTPETYKPDLETALSFYLEDDRSFVESKLEEAIEKKIAVEFTLRLKKADGEITYVHSRGKPEIAPDGTVVGVFGVFQDVTKQKEYELEIQKANTAKSEFLANMSHEIRTPMNGVIGTASLLNDTKLTNQQRKYTDVIVQSGEALLSLINDILDLSKIEAGKIEISEETFNLKQATENLIELYSTQINEKDISLEFDYGPNLPEFVITDPGRIRQILGNILSNAIKFTNEGHINIRAYKDGEFIQFEVEDTGIGIKDSYHEELFENFSQAHSYSDSATYGGTGLGLPIARALTQTLGGMIGFTSKETKGSTFWFKIPLKIGKPEDARATKSYKKNNTYKQYKAHVLLAEDIETNQLIFCGMLDKFGITYDLAENGLSAANLAAKNDYDLIFMDLRMPIMDGFQATAIIRKHQEETGKRVPIITVTAYAMNDNKQSCLDAGMDDFVAKPIKLDTMSILLDQWLGTKSSTDEDNHLASAKDETSTYLGNNKSIDVSLLEEIREQNPKTAKKLAQIALADLEDRIFAIKEHIANSEFEAATGFAHDIKTISLQIGADLFAELARTLEHICEQDNYKPNDLQTEEALEISSDMLEIYPNIRAVLKSYID